MATNSVPSPVYRARYTTSFNYHPPMQLPSIKSLLDDCNIKDELLSPLSRVTMQVCFIYYCRIRELLNAQVKDAVDPDRVILHGLKKSNSYMIYLPGLSAQLLKCNDVEPNTCLFPVSYLKLYRDALKIGINKKVTGKQHTKRLHAARYVFAAKSRNIANNSELTSLLRHRDSRNYLFYI
jgi:hypothetical protein